MIDGEKFYDLYGNVDEFGWDQIFNSGNHMGSVGGSRRLMQVATKKIWHKESCNFLSLEESDGRWITGGTYSGHLDDLSPSRALDAADDTAQYYYVGFRLVRTIEQGDGEQKNGKSR